PAGSRKAKAGGRAPGVPRAMRRAWEGLARETGWPLAFAGERREVASPTGTPAPAGAADPTGTPAPAWTAGYVLDDLPAGCGAGGGDARSLDMRVSPESFVQPNRAGNRALVRAALEAASLPEGARALDLYCGAGNFTVPLAGRAARVAGVESSPFSLSDAEANARAAGRENVRFLRREAGRLEAGEAMDLLEGRPDLILLDPPRRGALEAIPLVEALAPRRVVYVSCNPATFARDARALEAGGYRMASALLAPMFPNTAHVETVTSWLRGEDSPSPEEEARPMEEASCS
ncbi:MAG: methyltransferase domain-containing protein, partial [bacterium]